MGLPHLDPDEYLVGAMFELGPLRPSGDGVGPTDWPVIAPFAETVGLDSDDTMTLARMCQGYHEAWRVGENPLAIPPVDQS